MELVDTPGCDPGSPRGDLVGSNPTNYPYEIDPLEIPVQHLAAELASNWDDALVEDMNYSGHGPEYNTFKGLYVDDTGYRISCQCKSFGFGKDIKVKLYLTREIDFSKGRKWIRRLVIDDGIQRVMLLNVRPKPAPGTWQCGGSR